MSAKTRIWILTLAFLGLVVSQLLGTDASVWLKGGEGGAVNLPGAANSQSIRTTSTKKTTTSFKYRVGYDMPRIQDGLSLTLPENMKEAQVVYGSQGICITGSVVAGVLEIPGGDLIQLREAGLAQFTMTLIAVDGMVLDLMVDLAGATEAFKLFVE